MPEIPPLSYRLQYQGSAVLITGPRIEGSIRVIKEPRAAPIFLRLLLIFVAPGVASLPIYQLPLDSPLLKDALAVSIALGTLLFSILTWPRLVFHFVGDHGEEILFLKQGFSLRPFGRCLPLRTPDQTVLGVLTYKGGDRWKLKDSSGELHMESGPASLWLLKFRAADLRNPQQIAHVGPDPAQVGLYHLQVSPDIDPRLLWAWAILTLRT
jgi:hypothetical protein